jgi:ABC-type uncharacterized transport system, ATPase component
MTGTAATMQIEENLALAARRGKTRTLRSGITAKEREEFKEKLATLGLHLEQRLTAKVGLLSGGQRQALTLLMATLKRPAYCFLMSTPPHWILARQQKFLRLQTRSLRRII